MLRICPSLDGYEFLMQNYRAGDRICIFGFSRGAYTARGLAGMMHKVGLLPASNYQQVPFAYKMFTRVDEIGWQQSNAFKKAFSVDVPIEFVGVWSVGTLLAVLTASCSLRFRDTVNSVGLIPRRLPFTTSNTIVRTFRHAIALDERRAKFKANLWNQPGLIETTLGVESQKPAVSKEYKLNPPGKLKQYRRNLFLRKMEKKYSGQAERPTDVKEAVIVVSTTIRIQDCFSICEHLILDVGGGSVANGTPHSLARIPLRWMVRECFKANTGIMFTSQALKAAGLDPANLFPYVQKRPPALPANEAHVQNIRSIVSAPSRPAAVAAQTSMTEEDHELLDAISPIYDQLRINWLWWILEFIPMKHRFQMGDGSWDSYIGANLGRGRPILKQNNKAVKVHRSVKQRMEAEYPGGKKYKPRASLDIGNVEWVD
ncbi:hypothetical protein DXG01_005792 [Tephrocybe rancida]|nr:hypothetical protein DXG01_005792 [Tephrocybe rancida]